MNRKRGNTYGLIFLLVVSTVDVYGLTDTIIDSVSYNYLSYYESGELHILGNYITKGDKKIKQGP